MGTSKYSAAIPSIEHLTTYVISTNPKSGYMQITKYVDGVAQPTVSTSLENSVGTMGQLNAEIARGVRTGSVMRVDARGVGIGLDLTVVSISDIKDPTVNSVQSAALGTASAYARSVGYKDRLEAVPVTRKELPFTLGDPAQINGGGKIDLGNGTLVNPHSLQHHAF